MAFKMAATLAFKKGFMEAGPVLLEPIASLKVVVPDKYTGDVMGDLNRRRGRVLGMNSLHGGKQEIVADVPASVFTNMNSAVMSRLLAMSRKRKWKQGLQALILPNPKIRK